MPNQPQSPTPEAQPYIRLWCTHCDSHMVPGTASCSICGGPLVPEPNDIPESTPPEQRASADELLAEVMHLWIDGYISKNPNSCADASISNETFAKISAHLDNVGIEVDYCGWSRKAGEKEE